MRMELEKQRIDSERHREESTQRILRESIVAQQSSTIEVPTIQETTAPAPVDVPTNILEVCEDV